MGDVILVRHGEYSYSGPLNERGQRQMDNLGNFIKSNIPKEFQIYSSTVKRAQESAEIIKSILGIEGDTGLLEELSCTYEDLDTSEVEAIRRVVDEKRSEGHVIMVTHYAIKDYIRKIIRWDWDIIPKSIGLEKGEAMHLNFEDKEYRIIPPRDNS